MRHCSAIAALLLAAPALAAAPPQFWNQTDREFDGVYLARSGSTAWAPNQALNDPDKSVSADERLALNGVAPGRYDVKLVDDKGHTCLVRGVTVAGHGKVAFAIAQEQLTDCSK